MSSELSFSAVNGSDKLRVIRRFPNLWGDINDLFDNNENFRLLCHEYCLATETLSRLNSASDLTTTNRRDEYLEIVRDLETEIMTYVDEYTS